MASLFCGACFWLQNGERFVLLEVKGNVWVFCERIVYDAGYPQGIAPTNKLNTPFLKEKNKKYVLGYMKLKICFRENI